MENKKIKLGTFYYSSWGYDQTNVDFYQVVGYKGKKTVILKEVGHRTVNSTSHDSDTVEPVLDEFVDEKEYTLRVDLNYPKTGAYKQHAKLYDGKPKYRSWGR